MSEFFAHSAVQMVLKLIDSQPDREALIRQLEGLGCADRQLEDPGCADRQATAGAANAHSRPVTLALRMLRAGHNIKDIKSSLNRLSKLETSLDQVLPGQDFDL